MQPLARTNPLTGVALTAAQVLSLIQDSPAVTVSSGLELLDIDLNLISDITNYFDGGTVTRANYATLHGTAALRLTTQLDWGTALVRPYMTLTDGVLTARFNLGAYLTSSPATDLGEDPITHEVDGFDVLHWINTPVGEAFVVEAGTGYLEAVEAILIAQGISAYQIDQAATASVLPTARVWAFDDNTTWLNVINDLLASIGYQGIWSDWDGRLRVQPYQVPSERTNEWLYSSEAAASMMSVKRTLTTDLFDAPNRWVFYWAQDPAGVQPTEGAGIYTYVNETQGVTSVSARGRVISAKPQRIDVVDQSALETSAQLSIDADLRLKTTVSLSTFPNPCHWHFDKFAVTDPNLGPVLDILSVRWTLPLDGSDMTHEWTVI